MTTLGWPDPEDVPERTGEPEYDPEAEKPETPEAERPDAWSEAAERLAEPSEPPGEGNDTGAPENETPDES